MAILPDYTNSKKDLNEQRFEMMERDIVVAVDGVSIQSFAGKSTTMRALAILDTHYSVKMLVLDRDYIDRFTHSRTYAL